MRPAGEWSAGLTYGQQPLNEVYLDDQPDGMADSRRTFQQAVILSGEVGMTERFSFVGALPWRSVDLSEEDPVTESGMGDLLVGVRHALTDPEKSTSVSATALYGLMLPTGKSNNAESIEENFAFTRGVVSAALGGEISFRAGSAGRITGHIDFLYPTGADEVSDPNGDPARYRFGASRNGSVIYSHSLAEGKITLLGGLRQFYAGADKLDGETVETRGGSVRRLLGGVLFGVARRQNVGILVERLTHANMNGDDDTGEGQILARTEIVVAWQGTFGTHRHEAGEH